MEIPLRYNYPEIQRRILHLQDHEVFKIILLLERKKWEFFISDHEDELQSLVINSNKNLTLEELKAILNGTFPQIYRYEKILINYSENCYQVSVDESTGNKIILQKSSSFFSGNIKIINYRSNGYFQNKARISEWLSGYTFLGNIYNKRDVHIKINHYNSQIEISNSDFKINTSYTNKFYHEEDCFNILIYVSDQKKQDKLIRHKKFGNLMLSSLNLNSFFTGIPIHPKMSIYVEYDDLDIEWYYGKEIHNSVTTEAILTELKRQVLSLVDSKEYFYFNNKVIQSEIELAAIQLDNRIQALKESELIYTTLKKPIFKKPTNENELVALYMKLEGMQLFPDSLFLSVLEYTPKKGIDAVGDFKLDRISNKSIYQPIEFEYLLENYFTHDHPISQTKLIICWDYEDDDYVNENCELINTDFEWLINIKLKSQIIPVILISKFHTFIIE